MKSLINVHITLDDLEGAVNTFEVLAKENKKLSQKFKLMEKLILVSNAFSLPHPPSASFEGSKVCVEFVSEIKTSLDFRHSITGGSIFRHFFSKCF